MPKECSICTQQQVETDVIGVFSCHHCGHTEGERGRRLAKPALKALEVNFPTTTGNSVHSPIDQNPSLLDPIPSLSANRVSSFAYDSLYPGALFEGIQTNKTKEHRVSVRIVDINLQQSTLAGFLTIHDLTDQHPEITTFFDGQIIGDTHGFVTNDWGASEKVDMTHWQQFTPYHHLHPSELVKPRMTLKHPSISSERGVLFMRWKERFLVPDHRVRAINGASYAGFYYICIELGSLMGALHADALERPTPAREPTDEVDIPNEKMEAETSPERSRRAGTGGGGGGARSRSRRSVSRIARATYGLADPSTTRIRIPGSQDLLDDDKVAHDYMSSSSPYASSSATPTAYAPSTSPVTGANRIRRASASASGARRRRLSIYSAGSVQAQMMDHGHAHPYAHAHAHSHSQPLSAMSPSGASMSAGYVHSGYGVGATRMGGGEERDDMNEEIMALEEALALDPIVERENERTREIERMLEEQRRAQEVAELRERYAATDGGLEDHVHGYGYAGARKNAGWIGGGAARLTGYYYHSERDHCDLYQKLELHHVPERTRGSFEFR